MIDPAVVDTEHGTSGELTTDRRAMPTTDGPVTSRPHQESAVPASSVPAGAAFRAGPGRLRRAVVLGAALMCAACGLVYELVLVAAAGSLPGDPARQTSVVLSTMVFAMGLGSLATKPLSRHAPELAFAVLEGALALAGGLCLLVVDGMDGGPVADRVVLVVVALLVGALIGTELPLLLAVVQRTGRPGPEVQGAATDLLAADYLGALAGGITFPFVLLPLVGAPRAALVAGGCNALAGAVVLAGGRTGPRRVGRLGPAALILVVAVLAGAFAVASDGGRPVVPGGHCVKRTGEI